MKEKLTIEHLAPYLPYGLRVNFNSKTIFHEGLKNGNYRIGKISVEEFGDTVWLLEDNKELDARGYAMGFVKPVLRPLSDYDDILLKRHAKEDWDITTQIEIVNFANKHIGLNTLSYVSYITLIKDHADVFGLIEKGLAINKYENRN